MGRAFTADEGRPGYDRVAIISHGLWERRYGSDPGILGSSVILDGKAHTVVGIMPERFWFRVPGRDVWVPKAFSGEETRDSYDLEVLARLGDEILGSQALEEANGIMAQIGQAFPESSAGHRVRMETLHESVFDEGFKVGTSIASVGVLLVLLIACANVANLLLTHAAGREREVALRGAMGASRSRIIRQFLTEATVIAALGGIVGVGLAVFGTKGMVALMPPEFPRVDEIGLSARVLLYTAAISMLTGIIFGLAPALHSSQGKMTDSLKEGGRSGSGSRGARLRKGLVIGEIALALVLLVSSALLVQAFVRIRIADLGFDRSDVLTLQTLLPEDQYADSVAVNAFWVQLSERLESIPGVEAVGGVTYLPMQGYSGTWYVVGNEDFEDQSIRKIAGFKYMLPGYLQAMDIPLIQGRTLDESDRLGTPRVVVINQALAELHWPEGGALGERINTGSGPREVVGIAGNTRNDTGTSGDLPMMFFPALQSTQRFMDWALEVSVPMGPLAEAVRSESRTLDPTIPPHDIMSLNAFIIRSTGGDTIMAKIMAALALIALVLALGGVYGVMAHSVSQRTRELGIRMSLGAQRGNVMSMVVRQGTILALAGIGIGIGVALAITRGLSGFLFGVSPFDPLTFGGVAIILFLAGFAATLIPARRATKVDPVVALRVE